MQLVKRRMQLQRIDTRCLKNSEENNAVVVFPPPDSRAEEIVAALDLKPYEAVILIIGGAGNVAETVKPRLADLFGRGIARAADNANALIIDGGTQAGVMAMIGQGVPIGDSNLLCSGSRRHAWSLIPEVKHPPTLSLIPITLTLFWLRAAPGAANWLRFSTSTRSSAARPRD
jgi:hypothetical protein